MTIKQIIEEADTRAGRGFDLAIQGLVVLSLISFSIETLPNLPQAMRQALRWMEIKPARTALK